MMKVTGERRRENSHTTPLSHHRSHLTDSEHQIINLRVYQAWHGNNIFCLGGRLIFGPDIRSLFLTVFLILVPVVLFYSFVSLEIIREFQPDLGNVLVGICVIFTAYVLVLLFLTSSRDPGIIPRNLHPPEDDSSFISANWPSIHGGSGPSLPTTKDVLVNGMVVKVKYCPTCMIYRPPRCSHCSICNNCVDRFDHHCPWVGQCIGKRNYRCFFMFVSSTTMLCLYMLAICWVNIKKIMGIYQCSLWRALSKSPFSGILILYTFICAWFVGGLTTFHLYLICTNQTTYENFRCYYDGKINPYNLGFVRNTMDIFFLKIPKSKNNFRAKIKVEVSPTHTSSVSSGNSSSPMIPKTSFDTETGKREAVGDDDFEELRSHIESVGALERCQTQPRHGNEDRNPKWEIALDMHMLATEFEVEHGL